MHAILKALPLLIALHVGGQTTSPSFVGRYSGVMHISAPKRQKLMKSEKDRKLVHVMDTVRTDLELHADHTYVVTDTFDTHKHHGTWHAHGTIVQLIGRDGQKAAALTQQPNGNLAGNAKGDQGFWMTFTKKK